MPAFDCYDAMKIIADLQVTATRGDQRAALS